MLYSSSLLVIHFTYGSVCMSILMLYFLIKNIHLVLFFQMFCVFLSVAFFFNLIKHTCTLTLHLGLLIQISVTLGLALNNILLSRFHFSYSLCVEQFVLYPDYCGCYMVESLDYDM